MAVAPFSWWGRWFPRGHRFSYWRRWYPEPAADLSLAPATPRGAALVLEGASTITWKWDTGVSGALDNTERRSNNLDDPTQRFDGTVHLKNDEVRDLRSKLAVGASTGATFLLGLPYEELLSRAAAVGAELPVSADFLALSDWAVKGQRVIVLHRLYGAVDDVIQDVGADSITIAADPGQVGAHGFHVMPAVPVFVDAQQTFARFPSDQTEAVEKWKLRASCAVAGFSQAPLPSKLALAGITGSGNLDAMWYESRGTGAEQNDIQITESDDALTADGEVVEDLVARTLHVKYMGDVTTLAQFVALVNGASELAMLRGTYEPTDVVNASDDEFGPLPMSGGADEIFVDAGKGATLTTFEGVPVWDQGIRVQGSVSDQIQTLTDIENLGALPYAAPRSPTPSWGRTVAMKRPCPGPFFQWFKLFLYTAAGSFRSWWLPSARPDLAHVAHGVGTLTVGASNAEGNVMAWYPTQRSCLAIVKADGTITYVRIASAAPSGGSVVLSIVDENGDPVTLGATPRVISWLEKCRFNNDELPWTVQNRIFDFTAIAKVIKEIR